jgi:phosphatidylglycerophosphatase A
MFFPGPVELATIRKLDLKHPSTWLATWGGLGFLTPGPGTWGSLGALPFGIIAYSVGGVYVLTLLIALVTYIGLRAIQKFEDSSGTHDSKMIVIDEVAGQLIALIPTALNPFLIFLSFIFFRFFDIIKPGLIGTVDKKMPGPRGVMADDILAGIAAALCIMGLRLAGIS